MFYTLQVSTVLYLTFTCTNQTGEDILHMMHTGILPYSYSMLVLFASSDRFIAEVICWRVLRARFSRSMTFYRLKLLSDLRQDFS